MRATAVLITVLAALNAVAPFSIDMYLSAFPAMARDLDASTSSVQLTMTGFLIGLASGQLVIGQLSDRYGRRRPLLLGTTVCLGTSALCAVAPTVEFLIGLRVLQGFGGAAGVVLARAVVADSVRGSSAVRMFSTMNIAAVLAPVAAPVLGGAIVTGYGWRAVFVALAILNLLTLLGVALFIDESLPQQLRRPGGLKALAVSIFSVLGNRGFAGYVIASAFTAAAMFGYVAASAFVLQDIVGLSPTTYSYAFASFSLALAAGAVAARRILNTVAPREVLAGGAVALVVITGLILLTVTLGAVRPVPTIVLMGSFMACIGFVYGPAAMLATMQVRHAAGTGSAIFGFAQYAAGAVVSPLVGMAGHNSAVPMGIAMFAAAVAAAGAFFILTRGIDDIDAHE